MSLGSSVNGTESQGAERSAAALLAALRERLAAYDELDRECTRLAQEEKTLETYVRNLMDSNVFT
ncbi:hypothetical protein H4R18_003335 [Coemansia javaensis]|uniref:Uncharacterized protein n=1 Tax=Coemansia javaensis TaxID=2761396 RepID=A0A9W8H8B9_9FUNG|nr:hypothetical protein H4R18_003335 [Coemansia javaensis]